MEIQLEIGENHRFELREALLVYREGQTSFVTKHDVIGKTSASPSLGPAQPLTVVFIEALVQSLGGSVGVEVLPENVLAKSDRMIAWWTPRMRRQMFYSSASGQADHLNGLIYPQPPLVWRVINGVLSIRALTEDKRPSARTSMAVAPYWNLSDDGRVCTGSMRSPENTSVASIPAWETAFYESAFTHANVGRLTRHEGGFETLWSDLTRKRARFPLETLITLPQTLAQFVRAERPMR